MIEFDVEPSDDDGSTLPALPSRRDGWTPFARRLFLEVLAETGRVSRACDYAGLSTQSAYALRHRDPLFAAGWDAACELARAPLADALYEQAVDGVTETIRRDGAIVAERHRHDSRLSIAVLHRLDKRCDRAEERGAAHLALVRRWDEWLTAVGRGDDDDARALLELGHLETSPHHQLHQLSLGDNPTEKGTDIDEDGGPAERFWKEDDVWLTDFPPPPGYDGHETRQWGDHNYSRDCTAEETELLEAARKRDLADERADDEEMRAAYLAEQAAYLADDAEPGE